MVSKAGKGTIITVCDCVSAHVKRLADDAEGKGYPDLLTRRLLRRISDFHANSGGPIPPICALVDFDPDGIGIMSTYKYGSAALPHENMELVVPSMQWLGPKSHDVATVLEMKGDAGLLRLTSRDRWRAIRMLGRGVLAEHGLDFGWRRELQVMLLLNFKAEIEMLSQYPYEFEHYLDAGLDDARRNMQVVLPTRSERPDWL